MIEAANIIISMIAEYNLRAFKLPTRIYIGHDILMQIKSDQECFSYFRLARKEEEKDMIFGLPVYEVKDDRSHIFVG